jgi:hypothetical protein
MRRKWRLTAALEAKRCWLQEGKLGGGVVLFPADNCAAVHHILLRAFASVLTHRNKETLILFPAYVLVSQVTFYLELVRTVFLGSYLSSACYCAQSIMQLSPF